MLPSVALHVHTQDLDITRAKSIMHNAVNATVKTIAKPFLSCFRHLKSWFLTKTIKNSNLDLGYFYMVFVGKIRFRCLKHDRNGLAMVFIVA